MSQYIVPLGIEGRPRGKMGKTLGLRSLRRLGHAVPKTFVCSAEAHARYLRPGQERRVLQALRNELLECLESEGSYAVRSSATAEDGTRESMAGRYATRLRVRGVDGLLEAIREVWASSCDGALSKDGSRGQALSDEAMEVLIQEMVEPVCSGASFSRNPVTGADEVVVEAVEGTSEALLQGGATPMRWVASDGNGHSSWPLLPTAALTEIIDTTKRVAAALRFPADLEWAFDGETVWWLQVRPITSLRGRTIYSNRIASEYLPGLVKPLVWSINVPMINGAWVDLFEQVVGTLSIDPLTLARQFHYRAYFNMSGMGALFRKLGLPEDTLEQIFGLVAVEGHSPFGFRWRMVRYLPRVLRFLGQLIRFHRRVPSWVAGMESRLDDAARGLTPADSLALLIGWSDRFLPVMRGAARARILSLLLHLTAGQLGRRVVRRQGIEDPSELELADSRLEALDPYVGIRELARALGSLPEETQRMAKTLSYEAFFHLADARGARPVFNRFLERFGHLSESGNDFSATPWSENPTAVLRLAVASDPAKAQLSDAVADVDMPRSVLRWARRVTARRLDRERVGAVFSKGFRLLHCWALAVGDVLVASGALEARDDVFYLRVDELQALTADLTSVDVAETVARRKREMAAAESVVLPDVILGDEAPRRIREARSEPNRLVGVAASRGAVEGSACVIRTIDEADRFPDGEVLVVPYSDVAWTPLFARAGAIVAESGGMLSHSAIVARELGIPAVVSVPNACTLLEGCRVRVNGQQGLVTVLGETGMERQPVAETQ